MGGASTSAAAKGHRVVPVVRRVGGSWKGRGWSSQGTSRPDRTRLQVKQSAPSFESTVELPGLSEHGPSASSQKGHGSTGLRADHCSGHALQMIGQDYPN